MTAPGRDARAHCDEGNGKTVLARFLRIGDAKYFVGKRTFLLCSDMVQPGIAIRWIIWYDLGFGTRRRETESKRLHHENGSAILRKCPPIAGGSVDGARFARMDRQART